MKKIKSAYFIGIGGIGMSALARYFHQQGVQVSGYDKTATALTQQLQQEGIAIHFKENVETIPKEVDVVVYTPAIPADHLELQYYLNNNYTVKKRAEVLGWLSQDVFTIAVAGSHGKTTVSSMIAHILHQSGYGCTAFIGGIMTNYNTNFISGRPDVMVVEADEYDRSFLHLHPNITIITAVDDDHLDIYETKEALDKTFVQFAHQLKEGGQLIAKHGVSILPELSDLALTTYDLTNQQADIYGIISIVSPQQTTFVQYTKGKEAFNFCLRIAGLHNVENALAAIAVAQHLGIEHQAIVRALSSFAGIKRRFEYIIQTSELSYIDDYAHHPEEIKSLIFSVRKLYKNKKISVIFQPHLYSRTRDLAAEFAQSLDLADEIVLLDIYPARELPIKGVTSQIILDKMEQKQKYLCNQQDILSFLADRKLEVLLTVGAGDIDQWIVPIKELLVGIPR